MAKHTPLTSQPPAPNVLLLKVPEASARYRMGQRRLRDLIADGEIPVIRMSRRILIRPEAIEAWLLRQESYVGAD